MTQGTSTHGSGLSGCWKDAGHERADRAWRRWMAGSDWRIDWARTTDGPAPLQLLALSAIAGLALGLLVNVSWRGATDGGSGSVILLAILSTTCAIAAVVARRLGKSVAAPQPRQDHDTPDGPSRLLAQMHHELRTPLNAMIGFSEAMLRELHGPLGHARYQEYVAHISESGGQLLKASEDALAVAATMSALVADRRTLRRERLPATELLREAWAASAVPGRHIRLRMDDGCASEIECDRQATSEALQHLLEEAAVRTLPCGAVAVRGGRRHIEIAVEPVTPARDRGVGDPADASGRPTGHSAGDGLRLVLARSLIEMQGATLSLSAGPQAEAWTARIALPATTRGQKPWGRARLIAGNRRSPGPARRVGFAAGAAARASAGSPAAPPA
jgi:signal transduction histidine kinase